MQRGETRMTDSLLTQMFSQYEWVEMSISDSSTKLSTPLATLCVKTTTVKLFANSSPVTSTAKFHYLQILPLYCQISLAYLQTQRFQPVFVTCV